MFKACKEYMENVYDGKYYAVREYHGLSRRISKVCSWETLNKAAELVLESGGKIMK